MVKDGNDSNDDGGATTQPSSGSAGARPRAGFHLFQNAASELVSAGASSAYLDESPNQGDDKESRPALSSEGSQEFLYDEWDAVIQDYRSGWCRVVERVAPDMNLARLRTATC